MTRRLTRLGGGELCGRAGKSGGLLACLIFQILASCLSAAADPPSAGYRRAAVVEGASINEKGEIILPDGRTVVLSGVDLPFSPDVSPEGAASRLWTVLAALVGKKPLVLWSASGRKTPDRWNRLGAQLVNGEGEWVQAVLLRQGLARVSPCSSDAAAVVKELLSAEKAARLERTGIWSLPRYALKDGGNMLNAVDSVQIVEGRVVRVRIAKKAVYLAMGENSERDLSVEIPGRLVGKLGSNPANWQGWRIRVRGWIGKRAGPVIAICDSSQIEIVEAK